MKREKAVGEGKDFGRESKEQFLQNGSEAHTSNEDISPLSSLTELSQCVFV